MASKLPLLFVFVMLFALTSANPSNIRKPYTPCKNLVLYFHDILYNGNNAANATSAIVAAPEGASLTKLAPQFHFGNIIVFDFVLILSSMSVGNYKIKSLMPK
ncbi:unnamed protein product [Lathyrus oleraceus]